MRVAAVQDEKRILNSFKRKNPESRMVKGFGGVQDENFHLEQQSCEVVKLKW